MDLANIARQYRTGFEGDQGSGTLGFNIGQDKQIFDQIFSRYRKLGESNSDTLVMISSVVHPPETLRRMATDA